MIQVRLRNPVVIGHSMGGLVTLTLLRSTPGVARAAVVVDVGPELSGEGAALITRFISSIGEYQSVDAFIDQVVEYDPFRSREHVARTVRYNLMQRADGLFVSKHDLGRRLATDSSEELRRRGVPNLDEVSQLQLPMMLVRGAASPVISDEMARRFVARLPRGELATVENCGHNVHSQNVSGFLEAVKPFLTRHS